MAATKIAVMAAASMIGAFTPYEIALAKEPGSVMVLEEIVVTVRKRAESLLDVPASVVAIGGDQLAEGGIRDFRDLTKAVPGLQFNVSNTTDSEIFMRGIGSDIQSAGADRSVAIFVDGVYMSRGTGTLVDLADLERVEVLRGPQSLLFGKNVVGGLIHYVTKKPSTKASVSVEGTVGNYGATELRAYATGPLSNTVAGSLSYSSRSHNGFAKITGGQAAGGDEEELNSNTIRGQLQLRPNDALDILFAADYTHRHDGSRWVDLVRTGNSEAVTYNGFFAPPIAALPDFILPNRNAAFVNPDRRSGPQNTEGYQKARLWGLSGRVDYDFGNDVQLSSITAWRRGEISIRENSAGIYWDFPLATSGVPILDSAVVTAVPGVTDDNDALAYIARTPDDFFDSRKTDNVTQVSQEFSLAGKVGDSWTWRTGVYYLHEDISRSENVTWAFPDFNTITEYAFAIGFGGTPAVPNGGNGSTGASVAITGTKASNIGVFAEAGYQFNDVWGLDLGVRYARDKKELTVTRAGDPFDGNYTNGPFTATTSKSWSEVLPSASLTFKPLPTTSYYLQYSRGYKAGGWNGENAQDATLANVAFNPEIADNFEIGGKFNFFDGRLRLNSAIYLSQYDDLQIQQFVNFDPQFPPNNVIANAQGTEAKGLELELMARAANWLDLNLNYAYTDCEFTKSLVVDSDGTDIKGNTCRRAAKNAFNAGARIHGPVGSGEYYARVDYSWMDEYFFDNLNTAVTKTDAEYNVNAAIGFTTSDRRWNFSLWGKNLTDELNNSSLFELFGTVYASYQPPRTFGLSVSWKN
jgi:iron complex outermembrane recepter protein